MSSTPQRTTPVRAIPSTLATRSSPSIPSPSQLYDPALRAVLRHRLIYNIFLRSALLSWVPVVGMSIWQRGGVYSLGITGCLMSPFLPLTLASALITWTSVALPVIVLRKVYLTSSRTCATSPSGSLKAALAKPSTFRSFITCCISSIAALALHVGMSYIYETDTPDNPRLSIFVKSKKHPHYLNGRLLYLLLSQLCLALGFSLRNIMLDRFVFSFSLVDQPRKVPYTFISTISSLAISILFATLTSPLSAFLFGLIRVFLLPLLYKLPLLPHLLRPFTAHFLHARSGYTLFLPFRHFSLLARGWLLGLAMTFLWESASALFDAYITRPVSTIPSSSPRSQPAILSLVSGVSSADGTFRYLAYTELLSIASSTSTSDASHRGQLFNDQKHNPHLWTHLVRESLLILGKDYQLLLRRGKPPPASALAPQAPPTIPKPSPPVDVAKPVELIRKPTIFQSGAGKQSPLRRVVEGLGSDGVLAQALDEGAEKANISVGTAIPELFRSVLHPPETEKTGVRGAVENKSKISAAYSLLRLPSTLNVTVHAAYEKWAPPQARELVMNLRKWWTQERPSRRVEACLSNRELDVVVVDVLSHLTAASLTEDAYGTVQRDIPRILEALLAFLQAVEDYRAEVRGMYVEQEPAPDRSPVPELGEKEREERERMRMEVERAVEVLGYVEDGLKEGVVRIVRTFGDKLLAFKFPPRTARKLQVFLEYC